MDYKELLKRAKENMPEAALRKERFEIPKIMGHIQGNKTVLSNFYQIADALNRDPAHMFKFILRELATPGELKKTGAILGRKISASMVNEKIRKYAVEFVLCPECGKPDTKIVEEDGVTYIRCMACGNKKSVSSI
jgi:translation initiation factor 2 subunit 2